MFYLVCGSLLTVACLQVVRVDSPGTLAPQQLVRVGLVGEVISLTALVLVLNTTVKVEYYI